jgi:dihydropteroate synthase
MHLSKNSLEASHKKHPGIQLPNGVFLQFSRPLVMSIINCTPDSFYPPSRAYVPEEAADRALAAEAEGADIIDFGAESSRPGAVAIDEDEEIRRLIPALRLFRRQSSLPVSVDTRKAAVARRALDEGADIINDVSSLSDEAMVPLCAERRAAVVLMHNGPDNDVENSLQNLVRKTIDGGVEKDKIILDPGFGFGKSTAENVSLLCRLATIKHEDYPLLVGLSRKRFIGEITGTGAYTSENASEWRLAGTIAANNLALTGGADIIRVHDTAAAVDLVKVLTAVNNANKRS